MHKIFFKKCVLLQRAVRYTYVLPFWYHANSVLLKYEDIIRPVLDSIVSKCEDGEMWLWCHFLLQYITGILYLSRLSGKMVFQEITLANSGSLRLVWIISLQDIHAENPYHSYQ